MFCFCVCFLHCVHLHESGVSMILCVLVLEKYVMTCPALYFKRMCGPEESIRFPELKLQVLSCSTWVLGPKWSFASAGPTFNC